MRMADMHAEDDMILDVIPGLRTNSDRLTVGVPPVETITKSEMLTWATDQLQFVKRKYMLPIWKFGITTDTAQRFESYYDDGWEDMLILMCTNDVKAVMWLETALIAKHRDEQGCDNILLGGDGGIDKRFPNHIYFVYIISGCKIKYHDAVVSIAKKRIKRKLCDIAYTYLQRT